MASANYNQNHHTYGEDDDEEDVDPRTLTSEDDDDDYENVFDGYSLSADVSESDEGSYGCCSTSSGSSSLSSCRRQNRPDFRSSDNQDFAPASCDLPATTTSPTVMFPVIGDRHVLIPAQKPNKPDQFTEVELMKERFAKLLLGEDMSGGGNGVCPALAISNAITNLAATVFGELWKMEPLPPPKRSMWMREMEWLLCVCDSIVELVPSVQEIPGGKAFEIMVPRPRPDLSLNLPVLKKLDAMLISILDGFHQSEFYYVDRGIVVGEGGEYISMEAKHEEKWWLPFPKVPRTGLSHKTRKHLQQCWKCTNQIYKAALAINNAVLSEMEVPKAYLDCLPKSGKACLGESLYRCVTSDQLPTEGLVDYLDLTSENSTLDIANKLEAALHFWRQKHSKNDLNDKRTTTSLGGFFDREKPKISAQRAETLLRDLKLHFPGLPQTALDKTKIHCNKDVGRAILESYSRVIESIAFNMMARIEDLVYIDDATRLRAAEESMSRELTGAFNLQNHHLPPANNYRGDHFPLLKKPAFSTRKRKLILRHSSFPFSMELHFL